MKQLKAKIYAYIAVYLKSSSSQMKAEALSFCLLILRKLSKLSVEKVFQISK